MASSPIDAAEGAMLGAFCGDAAGAVLEFIGRVPTPREVDAAMHMPGGGVWHVGPGQITDDSELALCQARGLLETPANGFNLENVARRYDDWIVSPPFGIGTTTMRSLGCLSSTNYHAIATTHGIAAAMHAAAADRNQASVSNGSLMRATPLGVWGRCLPHDNLWRLVSSEVSLTHSNETVQHAVFCYVVAIQHLIQVPGDSQAAMQNAVALCHDLFPDSPVNEWLQDAHTNTPCLYYPNAGFVGIGFKHAFRHLVLRTSYVDAITETLLGGGDTDTNAAIVGGLIGALWGSSSIPTYMKGPVLSRNDSSAGQPRPAWLVPDDLRELCAQLFEAAPPEL